MIYNDHNAVWTAWVLQKSFVAKWSKLSGITSNRALVRACYCKLSWAVCLLAFVAEPADEVEEGEQDEAGRAGHGRVARVELREKQLVIQRCAALWWRGQVRPSSDDLARADSALTQPCPCQLMCLWTTRKPTGPCPLTCPRIVSSQSLFWTPVGSPRPVLSIIHKLLQLLSEAPLTQTINLIQFLQFFTRFHF